MQPPARRVPPRRFATVPQLTLRRLGSADIDAVIALHDTLSECDRYLRFFTIHPSHLKALANQAELRLESD
jgi:hypothetical protein